MLLFPLSHHVARKRSSSKCRRRRHRRRRSHSVRLSRQERASERAGCASIYDDFAGGPRFPLPCYQGGREGCAYSCCARRPPCSRLHLTLPGVTGQGGRTRGCRSRRRTGGAD
ncbi:uncharacterized protein K452DRAFT_144791 [Aplosporella prunicola CBS 121167]|uniref:Uncharacterized protein n=1 Tax=Aplosporella prunicola CBS 121167 TaxID=1176127 RepID=A0A6A6BLS3_9PEZI|nr:uncharacterized protein K452DRAFT_144791 [Aplosporella prunicola CBS 121167]KAF2144628.1 hypothetical protein K452DRAFT_144791 [Aplosporella prunicola CBS 121167]